MNPYLLEFQLPLFVKTLFNIVPLVVHVLILVAGIALMFFPEPAAKDNGDADGKARKAGGFAWLTFWGGLVLLVFGMIGVGVAALNNDTNEAKAAETLASITSGVSDPQQLVDDLTLARETRREINSKLLADQDLRTTESARRGRELSEALAPLGALLIARQAAVANGQDPPTMPAAERSTTLAAVASALDKARSKIQQYPLQPVQLPSYGVMIMLGFIAAIIVFYVRVKAYGLDPNIVIDIGIISMIAGIIGARIWFVIEFWSTDFAVNSVTGEPRGTFDALVEALQVQKGGLVFYGGLALATLAVFAYLRIRKLPFLLFIDLAAISVPLGQAFGRIGCFLNGCCWGMKCPVGHPLATYYDHPLRTQVGDTYEVIHQTGDPVFMSQFIASMMGFVLFLLLTVYYERFARYRGETISLLFVFYGINRFLNQMLRADVPTYGADTFALAGAQWFAILTFVVGISFWVYFRFVRKGGLPPHFKGVAIEHEREAAKLAASGSS